MRIVSGFILREIVGETVAIPSGDSARLLSGLIALNETGRFLFGLLQQEQTERSLVAALLEEYEIDPVTAGEDVSQFLQLLRQHGLLVEQAD